MKSKKSILHLSFALFVMLTGGQSVSAQENVLYSFSGNADGNFPVGDLIADGIGNLYGVTYSGGSFNAGTVFELTPPVSGGGAWTETILYTFTGGSDGGYPLGGLLFDPQGNLFGTTYGGGVEGSPYYGGVAFELSPPTSSGAAWTQTVLFDFSTSATAVGFSPQGAMVRDGAGNLFGVATQGGAGDASICGDLGCGSVFELQPPAQSGDRWTLTDIHDFYVTTSDGYAPTSILLGPGGVLYGTTIAYSGTIFKLAPPAAGGAWKEDIIFNFDDSSGTGIYGTQPVSLALGKGGLYGTTLLGGNTGGQGNGTVFELTPASGGSEWTESILYNFTGGADGGRPDSGVIIDAAGNLYGTTDFGGTYTCAVTGTNGCGTVFKLAPPVDGGDWALTTLYDFMGGTDGASPQGQLLMKKGVLLGVTGYGGSSANSGNGTVFAIKP